LILITAGEVMAESSTAYTDNKVLWWLMGIVAFGVTASMSIVYQNLRYDMNDIKSNTVSRREYTQLEKIVNEVQQVQNVRNERVAIVDNTVTNMRTDMFAIRTDIKELKEFVFTNYATPYGMKKNIVPSEK
jgi:divalent metal cation (Fe/Co/Zn/Cd) transporter